MAELEITLPWPPSVNHYYRHVGPRILISREGRRYREAVAVAVMLRGRPRVEGRLALEMDAYPPDRIRRDLDNLQKGVWDSLKHAGVYGDDSQIDEFTVRRRGVVKGGKVVVRLRTMEGVT